MKVIFLQHVLHVAKQGEVKEVSPGYASNFLFPKKLAQIYTPEMEKQAQKKVQKKESDRRVLLSEKETITQKLQGEIFVFQLSGNNNKLYGSILPKDVAAYIVKKYHIPLTKKHIDFGDGRSALKTLGDHQIYIDLGENFAVKAIVRIEKE